MSKHESRWTRRYWEKHWKHTGGTLIEEFPAVRPGSGPRVGKRLLDGVIVLVFGGGVLVAACAPVASTPAPQALTSATLLIPLPLPEEECEWVRQGHTEHWDNDGEDRCVVDEVTWDIIGCESGGFDIEVYLTSECQEEEEFPAGYIHRGIALGDTAVVACDGEDPEQAPCRTLVTCSEDPEHPLCVPSPLRPGRCGCYTKGSNGSAPSEIHNRPVPPTAAVPKSRSQTGVMLP